MEETQTKPEPLYTKAENPYRAHPRDIVVGEARILFCDGRGYGPTGWALPGEVWTVDERRARACAENIDRLLTQARVLLKAETNSHLTARSGPILTRGSTQCERPASAATT